MATVQDRSGNNPLDLKYNSENRTAADMTALLLLTPIYPGEIVRMTSTGQRYRGLQVVVGAWGMVNVDM